VGVIHSPSRSFHLVASVSYTTDCVRWVACGPLIGVLGDMWAADEDAMGAFATGPCHHTNVLFANAAAGGCDAQLLPVWTDDVNAACCQQNGVFECDAGAPWSCDAECAIEFVPFWETCMLSSGMGNSADLASFASLYDTCQTLPPAEGMLLMREVNNLINDPWCDINTTSIISVSHQSMQPALQIVRAGPNNPVCRTQIDQANAPCSTDESGFCARTIESGLYTCDEDYCSVSATAAISLLDLPIYPPDSNTEEIDYACCSDMCPSARMRPLVQPTLRRAARRSRPRRSS
jgi:hypothetical protein